MVACEEQAETSYIFPKAVLTITRLTISTKSEFSEVTGRGRTIKKMCE